MTMKTWRLISPNEIKEAKETNKAAKTRILTILIADRQKRRATRTRIRLWIRHSRRIQRLQKRSRWINGGHFTSTCSIGLETWRFWACARRWTNWLILYRKTITLVVSQAFKPIFNNSNNYSINLEQANNIRKEEIRVGGSCRPTTAAISWRTSRNTWIYSATTPLSESTGNFTVINGCKLQQMAILILGTCRGHTFCISTKLNRL